MPWIKQGMCQFMPLIQQVAPLPIIFYYEKKDGFASQEEVKFKGETCIKFLAEKSG